MNAPAYSPPKHWFLRALALLALVAASCTVPNFEISNDAGVVPGDTHCSNLISDEGETGVDCGGTCPGCGPGGTCVVNNDCANNQCISGICQDASCTDGAVSGTETDIDCGGGACSACGPGLKCAINRDCASGVCTSGSCAQATCTDKTLNQDETDLDCGGSSCSACLPGQHCKLPTDCAGGLCTDGLCTLTCLDGKGNCDGDASNGCETNLKTDADHCGACDTPCSLPHATAACTGGSCTVATCAANFADCDGDPTNGCEVNTSTDPLNCSACGTVCSTINGTPSCVGSACQVACNAGFEDCDKEPANGCETNTNIDVTNCGKCAKACDTTMGSPTCKVGVCGVSTCKAGLGDCDADPTTCETNTTNDVNNCGGCGKACVVPNGTPSCVNSVCKVATCSAGFADCDGKISNGCETNIAGDAQNCGACGTICSLTNATAKCVNKACQVATCTAPWADCDGSASNGCETNTSTNATNCGGCGANGINCSGQFANATGKCVTSACQLSACSANFADCDALPSDGCEVDLRSNKSNCGVCGTVCQAPHGTNTCTAGSCVPSCGTTFGDCDGNVKTGCEAVFANDGSNCGGCGTVCQQNNASNVCTAGACNPTCSQSFFKSCDSNNNNGCETDDRTSKANCGGCGMACQDNQTSSNNCSGGNCAPVCLANHANCDGNNFNGCETPTATDPANCGGCGTKCQTTNASGSTCGGGTCSPSCNNGFAACSNPAAGCLTSIDTAAHCGNCTTACSGGTPFCVSRACAAHLTIGIVNTMTDGTTNASAADLILPHVLQTSAAANPYRMVLVGVTGYGNNAAALPASVTYNNTPMTLAQSFTPANVGAAIYYLLSADLPAAAGTYNVVLSANNNNNTFALNADVMELINVEQATSPIDAIGGEVTSQNCTSHSPSDPVNVTVAGDLVYSVAAVFGGVTGTTEPTGQIVNEASQFNSLGSLAGYLQNASVGSHTVTWKDPSCNASMHSLVSIKPTLTP